MLQQQYDPEDSSCVGPALPSNSYTEETNIVTDTQSGFTDFDELEEHNTDEAEYEVWRVSSTPIMSNHLLILKQDTPSIGSNQDTLIEFNQSFTHSRRVRFRLRLWSWNLWIRRLPTVLRPHPRRPWLLRLLCPL